MAGSKQEFIYVTDVPFGTAGQKYVTILNLDESNTLLVEGVRATQAVVDVLANAGQFLSFRQAKKLRPRTITFQGVTTAGKILTRTLVIPDPTALVWQQGGDISLPVLVGADNTDVEVVIFSATFAKGESRSFAKYADNDTGLDDGTQP